MVLNRKRKQQLALTTIRAAESEKSRKFDQENQRKRRKQRNEDFSNEHEDPRSESSSDETNFDESGLDEQALMKKTRRWKIEGGIIHMKGWETVWGVAIRG